MSFVTATRAGTEMVVCRTGYTGEHGYELVVPCEAAGQVWDEALAAGQRHGIRPCGLGARDTLRTEAGLERVNWRDMETEELGSVYESLLELTPKLDGGPTFRFVDARGHERKTTASYYTPDSLVRALLDERKLRFEQVPVSMRTRAAGETKKPPKLAYPLGVFRVIISTWLR